jgi:hypothetical protein
VGLDPDSDRRQDRLGGVAGARASDIHGLTSGRVTCGFVDAIPPTEPDSQFEAVLTYLKDTRGFDFTGYKRTSLARRVRLRMSQVGVTGFADYIDFLQVNSEEFSALFNTILINVTSFFRDTDAWQYLRTEVDQSAGPAAVRTVAPGHRPSPA